MRVKPHPTWIAGRDDPGEDPRRWLHAALWLDVELPDWSIRRREHVHVVAPESDPDRWTRVDIGAVPMRPADPGTSACELRPEEALAWLRRWLNGWTLEVHRHPTLGLVSALGEPIDEFQRRVLAEIRPEVQRRVRPPADDGEVRWQRGPTASSDPDTGRRELARGVAQLGREIESRGVRPVSEFVRRAEVGIVLTPEGTDLPSWAGHRSGRRPG